ncbi:MAG TPA: nuclear transport factor 2 family protein [Candidatus Binataceae bacterium]|nr:nuclear transport factor 2 family protein [Candidatus Binataceae bacterium]
MSVEDNKKTAVEFLSCLDKGDGARLAPLLADNFQYQFMTRMPAFSKPSNKQQMLANLTNMKAMAPSGFNITVHAIYGEGPHVGVLAESNTTAGNGKKYSNVYHFYFRVENGKIAEGREYCDTNHVREVFMS